MNDLEPVVKRNKKRVSKVQQEINKQERFRFLLTIILSVFTIVIVLNVVYLVYISVNVLQEGDTLKKDKQNINDNQNEYNKKINELNTLKEEKKEELEEYNKWLEENERLKNLS